MTIFFTFWPKKSRKTVITLQILIFNQNCLSLLLVLQYARVPDGVAHCSAQVEFHSVLFRFGEHHCTRYHFTTQRRKISCSHASPIMLDEVFTSAILIKHLPSKILSTQRIVTSKVSRNAESSVAAKDRRR